MTSPHLDMHSGVPRKHSAGSRWPRGALDEMFRMRHLGGMSDRAIAEAVGCSRARVIQMIGTKVFLRLPACHKYKPPKLSRWRPERALVWQCGLPSTHAADPPPWHVAPRWTHGPECHDAAAERRARYAAALSAGR